MAAITVIEANNGQGAYTRVVEAALKHGVARAPRGKMTRDLGYTVIEMRSPLNALALGCGRDVSQKIAVAEATQIIGGFSAPHLLLKANPRFAEFMDDGSFHGAYGARIRTQAMSVCSKIKADPSTRQAIITLWDPVLDNQPHRHDYPCTVALHFEVQPRDNRLGMNVFMRSNDVWLGLPYDLFQFAQLHMTIANSLGLDYGMYRHTALSMHLYETDVEAAEQIHPPTHFSWQPSGLGLRNQAMVDIMRRARITSTVECDLMSDATASEVWFRERFDSYLKPSTVVG